VIHPIPDSINDYIL